MLIYQAINIINNKFYIGKTTKTVEKRKREHETVSLLNSDNSIFHKAIRKYGAESFRWSILEETDNIKKLNELEIKWIHEIKRLHESYNMTPGGDGGSGSGELSNSYGRKLSQESKDKISNTLKEYYKTHDNPMKGTVSSFKGCSHTEETKKKISELKKGKLRSDIIGSKNPSARPIYCITTDERFDYATLASIKYGIDLSLIIKCCKGKIKKTKGYSFKYDYGN